MPEKTPPVLYTIGYATKPIHIFMAQLKAYSIDVVADIRSVPYSKVFKEYHRENIQHQLRQQEIQYVYLGAELGPRSKDENHYDESGQVQFDRLMTSTLFKEGIARLAKGLEKQMTIALMCAEKDSATCHRSLLVGHFLHYKNLEGSLGETLGNLEIQHINHSGEVETQSALEDRLVAMQGLEDDLFSSHDDLKRQAYEAQLKKTSYRKPQ
jgi:uncharacterized protein (DUF488 family)